MIILYLKFKIMSILNLRLHEKNENWEGKSESLRCLMLHTLADVPLLRETDKKAAAMAYITR